MHLEGLSEGPSRLQNRFRSLYWKIYSFCGNVVWCTWIQDRQQSIVTSFWPAQAPPTLAQSLWITYNLVVSALFNMECLGPGEITDVSVDSVSSLLIWKVIVCLSRSAPPPRSRTRQLEASSIAHCDFQQRRVEMGLPAALVKSSWTPFRCALDKTSK